MALALGKTLEEIAHMDCREYDLWKEYDRHFLLPDARQDFLHATHLIALAAMKGFKLTLEEALPFWIEGPAPVLVSAKEGIATLGRRSNE